MYLIGWKLNTKGETFDLPFGKQNNSVARKPLDLQVEYI